MLVEGFERVKDRIEDFTGLLELNPFGLRPVDQFSIKEVERVINESKDLKNNSPHSYEYRKQWMEAFLFVNQIGHSLPVYNKKTAQELTNKEIYEFWIQIKQKTGPFEKLSTFERQLFALALMRESMYRTTGQFPYSTQILSLIDGMMHPGDVITGIRTGQGKSLIDTMRASLLWLDSDRVDLVTDSVVNAERDLVLYAPYFKLLGIDCANKVITPKCEQEDYLYHGINFSTGAQLALFRAKLITLGLLNESEDTVSVVLSEADQLVLDDRRIYRYSSSDSLLQESEEWIYEEIYAFICSDEFMNQENSTEQDVFLVKEHLKRQAAVYGSNPAIIDEFAPEQWITWLESAVKVHYILKPDIDYVISEDSLVKTIHGRPQTTHYIELLSQSDDGTPTPVTGRANPEISYGDGMQQLLYAKHNRDNKKKLLVIEPETKTLISSNNKNFISYYLHRMPKGRIWGSTGTPGSFSELEELCTKFGFSFSALASHQQSQLKRHAVNALADEQQQFSKIVQQLQATQKASLVFFKDISTAKRFEAFLQGKPCKTQVFVGSGDEPKAIKNAAEPGMITIATNAIGRNSNVLYDAQGLDVYHTFIDTQRNEDQKTGRTDRQGSGGSSYYFLNRQNYPGDEITEIMRKLRQKAHEQAQKERAFQEDFFDLMDVLVRTVNDLKKEDFAKTSKTLFIKNEFSSWAYKLEASYRSARANKAYNQASFNNDALDSFLNLFNAGVLTEYEADQPSSLPTKEQLLARLGRTHASDETYAVYHKPVALVDCTPPEILAYHFLEAFSDSEVPSLTHDQIKIELSSLFNSVQKGEAVDDAHQRYLRLLNQSKPNLDLVSRVHQELVEDYIKSKTEQTRKSAFSKFWDSKTWDLGKLIDNRNMLLLFYGLSTAAPTESIIQTETLKSAIIALLDAYVKDSWFINSARKASVHALKEALEQAQNPEDLIGILNTHRISAIKKDIEADQHRFKKLNIFGSRFQNTLDKALSLSHALTGTEVDSQTVKDLYADLRGLVHPLKSDSYPFDKNRSFDAFHAQMCLYQASVPKWGTAAVVKQSLDKTLDRALQPNSQGGLGKWGMFSTKPNPPIEVEDRPKHNI